MKNNTKVKYIWDMFVGDNLPHQANQYNIPIITWRKLMDQMIDVFHIKLVNEYKLLQKYLMDLISVNHTISVNLNTDVENRFLCLFIGFPIALHAGILIAVFLNGILYFNEFPFNLCSKISYSETILLCFAILPIEKKGYLA